MTRRPTDLGATGTAPEAVADREAPHVLLVDDEPVVSRSIAKLIERLGYRVTVATSGREALAAAGRVRYDVVLTDHQMPGMSGAELIASLVSTGTVSADRIILTTGDLDSPATRSFLAAAGCRCLEKPFHIHDLATMLKGVIPPLRPTRNQG
jgi:CheY-like chemotaxis protein